MAAHTATTLSMKLEIEGWYEVPDTGAYNVYMHIDVAGVCKIHFSGAANAVPVMA